MAVPAAAGPVPATPEVRAGDLLRACRRWIRENWLRTLVVSVVSFAIVWLWNTYIMATDLEGSVPPEGSSTTATAEGRALNGVYWLLVSTIVFGVIEYGRARGVREMFSELARLPRRVADSIRESTRGAWAMLLWGLALGLFVGAFLSQAVAAALGAGLFLASSSAIATIVNNVLIRVWVGGFSSAAPALQTEVRGIGNPFLMMIGEAAGMLVAWIVGGSAALVVLALVATGVSVLIVTRDGAAGAGPPPAAWALLVVALVVAFQVLDPGVALADDGGWSECVDDAGNRCRGFSGIFDWIRSDGADVVIRRGALGGAFGGAGAAAGAALGGALGSMAAIAPPPSLRLNYAGTTALDTLRSFGAVVENPPASGAYTWAPGHGPESAERLIEGSRVPAPPEGWPDGTHDPSTVRHARVEVATTPEGTIAADGVRVEVDLDTPAERPPAPPPPGPAESGTASRTDVAAAGVTATDVSAGEGGDTTGGPATGGPATGEAAVDGLAIEEDVLPDEERRRQGPSTPPDAAPTGAGPPPPPPPPPPEPAIADTASQPAVEGLAIEEDVLPDEERRRQDPSPPPEPAPPPPPSPPPPPEPPPPPPPPPPG